MKILAWRGWLVVALLVAGMCLGAVGVGGWAAAQVARSALPELADTPAGYVAQSNRDVTLANADVQVDGPADHQTLPGIIHSLSALVARMPGVPCLIRNAAGGAQRFLAPAAVTGSLALDAPERSANTWVSLAPAGGAGDQVAAGPGATPAAAAMEWVELRVRHEMSTIAGVALQ